MCPEYWPYQAQEGLAERSEPEAVGAAGAYVASVRRLFRQRLCVQGRFGVADERLARQWHRTGVPLEAVRRAILLGSVRKSMALLDHPESDPVRSLRYFTGPLAEAGSESLPASYWQHLEFHLGRCERSLRCRTAAAPGRARPDLAQARASGEGAVTSSEAVDRKDEETG